MDDYRTVREVYDRIFLIQLGYRCLEKQPADCLLDTIDSCICIMGRGSIREKDYKYFSSGINAIQGHLFSSRINGENAGIYASEVMYLAANILTGQTKYESISNPEDYKTTNLNLKGIKKISGIRNTNPLAYAYLVKSLQILNDNGLYIESIM